jgi:hypothetical protein
MAHTRIAFAFFLTVLALFCHASQAAATCEPPTTPAYINLVESGGIPYPDCIVNFPVGGQGLAFVSVQLQSIAVSRVSLSVPNPPFGILVGAQWNYPTTGDIATGIEFDLGGCVANPILGQLVIIVPDGIPPDCQPWKVNDGAVVEDCDGNVLAATSVYNRVSVSGGFCNNCCLECCASLPAYNLFPPDGATGLPLNLQLSWDGTYSSPDPDAGCFVEIGTDPDCANWVSYEAECGAQTFSPDFLQPHTTYYWRVVWTPDPARCHGVTAPRTFRVDAPVVTEASTWGRVKAMYRD